MDMYLVQQLRGGPLQSHSKALLHNVFLTTERKHYFITSKKGVRFLLSTQDIPILAEEGRRQQAQEINQVEESLGPGDAGNLLIKLPNLVSMQSLDQLPSPTLDLLIGHINQVVIMASSSDLRKAITQQPDGTFQQIVGGECTLALKIRLVRGSFSLSQSAPGSQYIHMCPLTGPALR